METRHTLSPLIALLVSAVMMVSLRAAALPADKRLEHIPVQGAAAHHGDFVGSLTIVEITVNGAGQLLLTGVLDGTARHCTGAKTQITHQTFIAPATLLDSDQTTDVLVLKVGPIALAPVGWQTMLAPITLDIDAVPIEEDVLAKILYEK